MSVDLERLKNAFEDCIKSAGGARVCVCLDWLSVLFYDEHEVIPVPWTEGKEQSFAITDNITLNYVGGGSPHFKYIYNVLYGGEHLATLLAYGRSPKFVKKGTVKVDFKNHLLYSNDLWPVYDSIVKAFSFQYRNISRVDIALDGLNYILDFLNLYHKQDGKYKVVDSKGLARFNAKVLDKNTMKSQNFFIGGSKGRKTATVYNKSLDIVKTGKEYIQQFWLQNGIVRQLLPLEELEKAFDKEKIYVPGYENIFRFEIRLRGERISEIEKFDINLLKTTDGLISLLKFNCTRFFEFYWLDNGNVSRCTPIDLIPFHRFNIIPIEKAAKKPRTNLYKTKLSLGKNVNQLYTGHHDPEDYGVLEMIRFDIETFQLQVWFEKKYFKDWKDNFGKLNDDAAHVARVDDFLETIIRGFNPNPDQTAIEFQ